MSKRRHDDGEESPLNQMIYKLTGIEANAGDVIIGRDANVHLHNNYVTPPADAVKTFMQVDSPTPYFTGRTSVIDKIHQRFKHCFTNDSYANRIVVLHGMGGIGKSELARVYANSYSGDRIIQNIAWIDAETETSLRASFEMLTKKLQMPTGTDSAKQIVESVYQHFSDHIRTGLFIFDNAPQMNRTDTHFGVYEFLPKQLLAHRPLVLITSRDNEWDGITFLRTCNENNDFQSAHDLFDIIIKLACDWNCSAKIIDDGNFMESLLLYSNHLFVLQNEVNWDYKAKCLFTWFSLFRQNESVSDSRGRSWCINDVANEFFLFLASKESDEIMEWYGFRINVFEDFVEATNDQIENVAMEMAKKIVKLNTTKQ